MNKARWAAGTGMAGALSGLSAFASAGSMDEIPARPNVVVILADDLGYADVGYHGCKDIPTPHIDSIAKNGVRFTQGYVSGPVCSPTRAGLMSGRYQQRLGCEGNPGPYLRKGAVGGLPLSVKTMGDRFKELGYRTACFGKWHLGGERGNTELFPLERGFDEFFGFLEGAARYEDVENVEEKYIRGSRLVDRENEYYTDALGREAVSFIQRSEGNPFLLYLPFNAVHAPMQVSEEYLSRFKQVADPNRRKLCAMNYAMDVNIGRVLAALEETGVLDNTLIIFLSDNGGKPKNNFSVNHPFRGQKGDLYDGGIHIPFCLQWNGKIVPGSVYEYPVISLDILPTVLAAVGENSKPDEFDGVNLLPFLFGENEERPHSELYWKIGKKFAVRSGDWKLVKNSGKVELFNLAADPFEKENLAGSNSQKCRELQKEYDRWDRDNLPANYGWNRDIGPKQELPAGWKQELK